MTNLTKEKREQIIESVITKGTTIPERKADLKKRTALRVRELCLERVPAEFFAATKNMPAEWFPHCAMAEMPPKVCPDSYVDLTDDQLRNHWRARVSFEPFRYPINVRFDRTTNIHQGLDYNVNPPVPKPDDPESWEARLADLLDEAKEIRADEKKARDHLVAFLASVRTYKQVLEQMPELETHLPGVVAKSYPVYVPTGPIVKLLTDLGFDKSMTP